MHNKKHENYLVGNPLRIVIPGGVGPSADIGFGVVILTPGRFPMPFGKMNFGLEPLLFAADFSFGSAFSFESESSDVTLLLNPGGNKLLTSVLNDSLFKTLAMASVAVSGLLSGFSVVVNLDNL